MFQFRLTHLSVLAAAGSLLVATSGAEADLLIYEGFQYGPASTLRASAASLQGQSTGAVGNVDATGIGGTWNDVLNSTTGELFMYENSLDFKDLPTAGNSVRSDTNSNNDIFVRPITASLSTGSELWFSFTANKLQNNFSAAEGGIAITNQNLTSAQIQTNSGGGLSGFAISPTTAGNNWSFYAWSGGTQVAASGFYTVPTDGTETNLLVGKITLNAGTGGADIFEAFYYDKGAASVTADEGNLISIAAAVEVDVDESALDVLNVTRQVNTAYDEIRVADNFAEVIGIPEPASLILLGLGSALILGRRRH